MRRRTVLFAPLATAALLVALAGCSDDPGDPTADATTPSPSTTGSTPTEPTDTETTTEPTETSTTGPTDAPGPSGSALSRAKRAQIPAKDLPGFNDQWFWRKQGAGPGPGQDVPSVCQKASLTSIGAVAEYRTDFNSPLDDNDYAVQMTGVFPDVQTVATAEQVLQAWHESCKMHATKDLGLEKVRVGDLTTVPTEVGDGVQWLTLYGPAPSGSPDEGWFEAVGYVADGDTLTLLVMANVGQDYNYDAGRQPMDLAVQETARRLMASR
jgi:hypothetical protein